MCLDVLILYAHWMEAIIAQRKSILNFDDMYTISQWITLGKFAMCMFMEIRPFVVLDVSPLFTFVKSFMQVQPSHQHKH